MNAPVAEQSRAAAGHPAPQTSLHRSRLLERGGFEVIPKLLHSSTLRGMFDEACAMFARSHEEKREGADTEEWRGGRPPRQLLCAEGGPIQDRVYVSPELQHCISQIVGGPVQASSNRASYSYYCRAGDHLAVHRDVEGCDVSVIIAVSDNTDPATNGGEVLVYPDHIDAPLSAVRKAPSSGAVRLKLAAGSTLVILGGLVPHAVTPVETGQYRISAPMCFRTV